MTNALIGTHAMPGPNRQFTLLSLGDATGTVGVEVNVGGGALVGSGVCVGKSVGSGCVTVAEGSTCSVGVSVGERLDGRLQASIAKTSTRAGIKVRAFIISPLHYRLYHKYLNFSNTFTVWASNL